MTSPSGFGEGLKVLEQRGEARGPSFTALLLVLALSGCVSTVTGSTYYDGRFWYSNIKSASDIAGGPRQDLIVIVDRDGSTKVINAAHEGTLQSIASGLGAAVVNSAGHAGGSALVRPARNTTNVQMEVQGTGGSGGTGGTSTTSSSAAGGSNTVTTTNTATGGTATTP